MTNRTITLHDGRTVPYRYRRSPRARHIGLRLSRTDGLVVTLPPRATLAQAEAALRAKSAWLIRHLDRLAVPPPLIEMPAPPLPEAILLPALGEEWPLIYRMEPGTAVRLIVSAGVITLIGAVSDTDRCRTALRHWLARRATEHLLPLLAELAAACGFAYRRVQIRGQRSRWGSCSASGTISLNWHLLFLPPELVRHILIHELCHTVELNHSPRFWQLLAQHHPLTPELKATLARAWRTLPPWLLHPPTGRID